MAAPLVCPLLSSCSDDDDVEANSSNGHEYVDLGLPSGTLWATCNIGVNSPEEYGDYYAWGETYTKASYTCSNYFDSDDWNSVDEEPSFNKYYNNTNGHIQLLPSDDVAVQEWGGNWCVPTLDQINELINNCVWYTTDNYNGKYVKGFIGFKKKSGSSYDVKTDTHILFPAAGFRYETGTYKDGDWGCYWTKDIKVASYSSDAEYFRIDMEEKKVRSTFDLRMAGMSVRPVLAK